MENKRNSLMLDFDKINQVKSGDLPKTTKVGSAVIDGEWKAVFLQTTREGEIVVNRRGEVQFNITK